MLITIETVFAVALNAVLATVVWMRFREMRAARFFMAAVAARSLVAVADQIGRAQATSIEGQVAATLVMWSLLPLLSLSLLLFFLSIYAPEHIAGRKLPALATAYGVLAVLTVATAYSRSAPFLATGQSPAELRALYPAPWASGIFNASWLPILILLTYTAIRLPAERRAISFVILSMLLGTALGIVSIQYKTLGNAKPAFDVILSGSLAYLLFQRRVFETTKVAIDRAISSLFEGVAVLSAEGRVLFTNPAMERYMSLRVGQLAGEEQRFGETIAGLLGKDWAEVNLDRDSRSLVVASTPILDAEEKLQGHLLLTRDVTDARRRDRELSRQNVELESALAVQQRLLENLEEQKREGEEAYRAKAVAEAASAAKSAFLASMSHELRTPLNAILGFAQLMRRDTSLTEPSRRSLSIIDQSGQHLLGLINNVLEMSKIEAARAVLHETSFDLHRMLSGIEEMFQGKAADKGIALTFDLAPDLPRHAFADESKLRQVLINLLGNALKHTSEGGVRLKASKVSMGDEGATPGRLRMRFQISDTGIGIDPASHDDIFEPFSPSSGRGGVQDGSGLGLSISRELVRLMGGDVSVESALGKGATFSFEVDARPAASSEVAEQPRTGIVVGIAEGQTPPRIVVADDHWENRDLLVQLLTTVGFEVRGAANGKEAVALFEEWDPQLIWMDMRMPVLDGYQATRLIKAQLRGQATVIIAITASAFEHDRAMVLAAGCDDFVRKPFRDSEIFDKMVQHLGVKLVYSDALPARETPLPPDSVAGVTLALLPPDLRVDLRRAATSLSAKAARPLLDRIRTTNPDLADSLEALIGNYRYDRIIALLDRAESS